MCWSTSDYNGMNRNCNGLSTSFDDDMAMQNISNIRTGNVYWPFLFGYCGLFFPAPGGLSFPAREWPFSPDPNKRSDLVKDIVFQQAQIIAQKIH